MPKRILLVDDEETITNMLAEFFVQAGYDVTEAMNGREAIEIAEKQRFDAVITDINMPDVNGIELATYLKLSQDNSDAKVFVLSGVTGLKKMDDPPTT